jgi:hypothetical protein
MNLRHILRINIRLNLDVVQATSDCLDGDLEKSLIFAAISAANVGQLDDDPVLTRQYAHTAVPDDLRRPIRIQRVADSLGLPRETTRVKVNLLIGEGLLQTTRNGLLISSAAMNVPRFGPMMLRYLGALDRAIERLALSECAGLRRHERLHPAPFPAMWGSIRLATQHVLRGTVDLRSYTAPLSLLGSYLYLAMADHTSSHFSEGPEILFADHDDPPPNSARRTISASALAAKLAMPRETVRRNLKAMVAGGWLYQDSSGFGLPTTEGEDERKREHLLQERSNADLSRLVRKLRHIGAIVGDGTPAEDHSPST